MFASLFDRSRSLSRGLRRTSVSKRGRRAAERRTRLEIDQLESRLALAITSPLSIGGATLGSFTDTPTGPGNVGDFVTVSITGTSGTVIFNDGAGVADGGSIQTIKILNASPDFQITVGGQIRTANAVPYGSDGVIQLGKITASSEILGINTVRGPLTNVAPTTGTAAPIGFTQTVDGGASTFFLEGDQTSTFKVEDFVCATPLLPNTNSPPVFGKVTSSGFDSNTNLTTVVLDNSTAAGTTAGALMLAERVQPSFELTSFVGTNFSTPTTQAAGGLFVDRVIGADTVVNGTTITDLGILLTRGLVAATSIGIRDELAATVILGTLPTAAVNGRIFVDSATTDSRLLIGPQQAPTPQSLLFQLTGGSRAFGAQVDVQQQFNGTVNLQGAATGSWLFRRGVASNATLAADSWTGKTGTEPQGVTVRGNFGGRMISTSSDLLLDVSGNLTPTARLSSYSDIDLKVGGSIQSGAVVSASTDVTLDVGGSVLGSILGNISGTVKGNLNGATLASENDITLVVGGSLLASSLSAGDDISLKVGGNVTGSAVSAGSDLTLDIAGSVTNAAFNATDDVEAKVGGSVTNSKFYTTSDVSLDVGGSVVDSVVRAGDDVSMTIKGSLTGSKLTAETDVSLDVGGSVVNSIVDAGEDISMLVKGGVSGSSLSADSGATLDVTGSVSNTSITSTDDISLKVGGNLTNAKLYTTDNVTLDVGGSVIRSLVTADGNVTMTVKGALADSTVVSNDANVSGDVGGDVTNSRLTAAEADVTLTAGRGVTGTQLAAGNNVNLSVKRNFQGSVQGSGGGNVIMNVLGSVLAGTTVVNNDNGTLIDVAGNFNGGVTAKDLRFFVDGSVTQNSRIVARRVTDWQSAGDQNFNVGGQFNGLVNVVDFDAAPNDATVTLIGGGAGPTARFSVDRFNTDTLVFNGNFQGNMRVLRDLVANLDFRGNLAGLTVGGRVGSYTDGNTPQVLPVTINVAGRLQQLNTNSYFQAAVAGKNGTFYNDVTSTSAYPSLAATGLLTTGSYRSVLPTRPTAQPAPGPTTPQIYAKPTAPTLLSAVVNGSSDGINVTFGAPSSDGGLPVVVYEYTTDNGATWRRFTNKGQGPTTDPVALPGQSASGSAFVRGNSYTVAVRAVNAIGASTASSSQLVSLPPLV